MPFITIRVERHGLAPQGLVRMNATPAVIAQRRTGKRLWQVNGGRYQNRQLLAVSQPDLDPQGGNGGVVPAAGPYGGPYKTQRKKRGMCQRLRPSERQRPVATLATGGALKMPDTTHGTPAVVPQHFLAFLPELQGQGSLRPIFMTRWGTICELRVST